MRQSSIYKTILTVVFCICIGLIGGMMIMYFIAGKPTSPSAQGNEVFVQDNSSIEEVARAYQDCTVAIRVVNKTSHEQNSLGSGVCVKSGGYIVTNYHVISSCLNSTNYEIQVVLNDESKSAYYGQILWASNHLDLAIVKCEYENITYAKMKDRTFLCEDNQKLQIGDEVIAIGTPIELSLQNTTTFGRVNGLNRVGATTSGSMFSSYTRVYEYMIQHQATINSGNSGGPLIDKDGYVVGINSCSMVEDKNNDYVAGVNFAVPILPIMLIIDDVVASYESGVEYIEPLFELSIIDSVYKSYTSDMFSEEGVYVKKVNTFLIPLLQGDIIKSVKYNNSTYSINCVYDFVYHCLNAGNGAQMEVTVLRGALEMTVQSTLPQGAVV